MRRIRCFTVWVVVLLFAGSLSGVAQVLTPSGYDGQCRLTHQEAIAVSHQGQQFLALEARYQFEPAPVLRTGGTRYYGAPANQAEEEVLPPVRVAWVVPIPAGGEVVEPPSSMVLEDLHELTHPSTKIKYRLKTGRPTALNRFGNNLFSDELASPEEEGLSWTIVEGSGEAALSGLAEFLNSENLTGLDEVLAKGYAARGWTFAVGLLEDPEGMSVIGPAAFRFPSEELVFPLRFQANAGEFDLSLYVVSDREFETRSLSQWRIRGTNAWENLHREAWFQGYTKYEDADPPEGFVSYLDSLRGSALQGLPTEGLLFYAWEGKEMNGFGKTTADLKQDFGLAEKGVKPKKPSGKGSGRSRRSTTRRSSGRYAR
jgi:hypothetical protein